ncbi:MAG: diphosphate--fructose-6-phosphate 1-phosphotransferase, partial [Sedimentisphaerales bacterium]|nr:diphosphate--fructose-6-phosphate 1-phosphotransferase [Sedimentisphaerales bacterium]
LGSTRDKPDEAYCEKIFEVCRKHKIHYFFYIGGNDSASTANIVNDLSEQAGYDLRVFHVPKTIDNDLLVTDHCPGFGSAAKFVNHAIIGDDFDNRSLKGIKIDIIMGRHAGFLTAAAVLARREENDGPHLIYVPERPISMNQLVADVNEVYGRLGRCLVVVSEGICDEDGVLWAKKLKEVTTDAHGNVELAGSGLDTYLIQCLKKSLPKARMRCDTFGYLQRSFAGIVSDVDAREARMCGKAAVEAALTGLSSGSIAIKRTGHGAKYAAETFVTTLASVAEKTKSLAPEYINKAGNNITPGFVDYVAPLVGPLPDVGAFPC